MKKETLEEVAERIFNIPEDKTGDVYFGSNIAHLRKGFKFGAKWQQEQDKNKFSEEDMKKCWDACLDFNKPAGFDNGIPFNEFLNNLKTNKI